MATRKKTAPAEHGQTPAPEASAPHATTTGKAGHAGRSTRSLHAATGTPVATRAPLLYSATRATRALDRTPARAEPSPEPGPEKGSERPASVRQRFGELRGLLADGWEIVQPIFARPLWSAPDNSTTAFSFVLRRENATRLLTVPEGRTVQRFIRERNLLVDYRG